MIIEKDGFRFEVDAEATKEYYRNNTPCDCPGCRNFYAQVRQTFPELNKFLSAFGVDIAKPDEIGWNELNNEIDYIFAAYTVCGKILQSDRYEAHINDNQHLIVTIDKDYIPNEQKSDDYFVITVHNIRLLWVLDEPFPSDKSKKVSVAKRIRNILSMKKRPAKIPPVPSFDKVVEMMYDKNLDAFEDEVIRVIYSTDKTMRYVVLKDDKGLFSYCLERIYQFDREEWKYIFSGKDTLPAMWEVPCEAVNNSILATEEELMKELVTEPVYKQFFITDSQ